MGRFDWGQVLTSGVYIAMIGVALGFGHTGLQGEYGLGALRQAAALEAELIQARDALAAERAAMENKVRRLGEGYLDLDLLDERARAVLGHVRADEVVIR